MDELFVSASDARREPGTGDLVPAGRAAADPGQVELLRQPELPATAGTGEPHSAGWPHALLRPPGSSGHRVRARAGHGLWLVDESAHRRLRRADRVPSP